MSKGLGFILEIRLQTHTHDDDDVPLTVDLTDQLIDRSQDEKLL